MSRAFRIDELAEFWRISNSSVKRLLASGHLRYFQIARTIRIDYEDIEAFCKKFPRFPLPDPKLDLPKVKKLAPRNRLFGEKSESVTAALIDAMGEPSKRILGDDLQLFRSVLVYAWIRGDKILYIGKSQNGLVRPIDPHHHRLCAFRDGDELLLWTCATAKAAERIEMDLIKRLKPFYNTVIKPIIINDDEKVA